MVGDYAKKTFNRIKECADNFRLDDFVTSIPSQVQRVPGATVGRIFSLFRPGGSNTAQSSAPRRGMHQIIKELVSAFIMGVAVGTLVDSTIKLILYLLCTRAVSIFVSVVLTVIYTLYINAMFYFACVSLISIATIVAFIAMH